MIPPKMIVIGVKTLLPVDGRVLLLPNKNTIMSIFIAVKCDAVVGQHLNGKPCTIFRINTRFVSINCAFIFTQYILPSYLFGQPCLFGQY